MEYAPESDSSWDLSPAVPSNHTYLRRWAPRDLSAQRPSRCRHFVAWTFPRAVHGDHRYLRAGKSRFIPPAAGGGPRDDLGKKGVVPVMFLGPRSHRSYPILAKLRLKAPCVF